MLLIEKRKKPKISGIKNNKQYMHPLKYLSAVEEVKGKQQLFMEGPR